MISLAARKFGPVGGPWCAKFENRQHRRPETRRVPRQDMNQAPRHDR